MIKEALTVAAGLYALGYFKKVNDVQLRYFKPSEFGAWFPMMDADLLMKLDEFRHRLGLPVMISPAFGALGRMDGSETSQHFAGFGIVRAADVMPCKMVDGVKTSLNEGELKQAYNIAVSVGFNGIGVYPDWKPYAGFHLDMRVNVNHASRGFDTWSAKQTADGQKYFDVNEAWA